MGTALQETGVRRRLGQRRTVAALLAVDLVVGVLGVYPLLFLRVPFLAAAVQTGLLSRDYALRDGYAGPILVTVALWALYLPVLLLPNLWLARRSALPATAFWPLALLVVLVPTAACLVWGYPRW